MDSIFVKMVSVFNTLGKTTLVLGVFRKGVMNRVDEYVSI